MKSSTINKEEIEKFSKWLHSGGILMENSNHYTNLIPIRIGYIKNSIIKHFKLKPQQIL